MSCSATVSAPSRVPSQAMIEVGSRASCCQQSSTLRVSITRQRSRRRTRRKPTAQLPDDSQTINCPPSISRIRSDGNEIATCYTARGLSQRHMSDRESIGPTNGLGEKVSPTDQLRSILGACRGIEKWEEAAGVSRGPREGLASRSPRDNERSDGTPPRTGAPRIPLCPLQLALLEFNPQLC